MKRHLSYLRYVILHKWHVFKACRMLSVPLWIAVIHDWSKLLPEEWFPYAETFYNPDGSKKPYKPDSETPEFKVAWNLHQKRHPHHWQAWMLTWDSGKTELLPMPDVSIREMLADWSGAGAVIANNPNPCNWYDAQKNANKIKLHPDTQKQVELYLEIYFWYNQQ